MRNFAQPAHFALLNTMNALEALNTPHWSGALLSLLARLSAQPKETMDDVVPIAHIIFGLLHAEPSSETARLAADCIKNFWNSALNLALHELGAIPLIVRLLKSPANASAKAGALALKAMNYQASPAIKDTIRSAGAVAPLVVLLRSEDPWLAANAAAALCNFSCNEPRGQSSASRAAICAAGALAPLVDLLHPLDDGPGRDRARLSASKVLCNIAGDKGITQRNAVLNAIVFHLPPNLASYEALSSRLQAWAKRLCSTAIRTGTIDALRPAIARAEALNVTAAELQSARDAMEALEAAAAAAKQARRESLGIGSLDLPGEFKCPITFDVMIDPVVASDGHSYERSAIEAVIRLGNQLSPLTREMLNEHVFPNFNLRRRIQQHEDEQEQLAEAAQDKAAERLLGSRKRPLDLTEDDHVVVKEEGGTETAANSSWATGMGPRCLPPPPLASLRIKPRLHS